MIKNSCVSSARSLIDRMRERFPEVKLVRATRFIYPDQINDPTGGRGGMRILLDFQACVGDIQLVLGAVRVWQGKTLPPLIDVSVLQAQFQSYFDAAQLIASAVLSNGSINDNDKVAVFWTRMCAVENSEVFSEWIKLAEITLVQVTGSSEDERVFSLMKLLKSALRNRLGDLHLQACMRGHLQSFVDLEDLWSDAGVRIMEIWQGMKAWRLMDE
jgi:hypothetical protein